MKMKWDGINGKGIAPNEGGGIYSGEPLPRGSWPCKIKRLVIGKIKNGPNAGKPRISVLLEAQTNDLPGKEQYHGAPVWDGLNIISSGLGRTNAFLHALTDGSESAKRAIESAFWDADKGPDIKIMKSKAGNDETHIVKIGKVKINSPSGEVMVQVTTKDGHDLQNNVRPEVVQYMPHASTLNAKASDDDMDDDVDDDDFFAEDDVDDGVDDLEDEELASSRKPF